MAKLQVSPCPSLEGVRKITKTSFRMVIVLADIFKGHFLIKRSRDSVVSIATGYGLDD
jgi:hypothetical protein